MTKKDTVKDDNGALNQRAANKEAALVAFKLLYNEGKEWPSDLYEDKSDEEKVCMHTGYMNLLQKIAKMAGVASKKSVAFDV